jgi:UDP-N-acetylmuramyl tripeptide synthase
MITSIIINSFAEYRDVKKSFFDHLPKEAFALSNIDDKNGLSHVAKYARPRNILMR